MISREIKTIGHSNHAIETFLDILSRNHITCIIDLRSSPYSRHNPQFNRETLKTDLEINEIEYLYMGDALGARYTDPKLLFPNGIVDFEKVKALPAFINGINAVIEKIDKNRNICLMCAEKDPFICHRFVLVSRALIHKNVTVQHIFSGQKILSQTELEQKLLDKYTDSTPQLSLFEPTPSRDKQLETAYQKHNLEIGYKHKAGYS